MPRLEVGSGQVTAAQADDGEHRQHGRDGEIKRDAAAVFGAEEIDRADHNDEEHGGHPRVLGRHAEIAHRRPPAQRRGHDEIRD